MDIESCFFSSCFHVGAKRLPFLSFLLILCALFFIAPVSAEPLLCGIDRLEASQFHQLKGLKVGLITNVAGINRKGEPDYAVMLRRGVRLKFIMAPEHGFSADIEAGKSVGGSVVHDTLPVFSLYGASKKPDIKQLKSIDILLFDLQDIGSRCYTYITTNNAQKEYYLTDVFSICFQSGRHVCAFKTDNPNEIIGINTPEQLKEAERLMLEEFH